MNPIVVNQCKFTARNDAHYKSEGQTCACERVASAVAETGALGWFLEFYILATFKIISGWAPICLID